MAPGVAYGVLNWALYFYWYNQFTAVTRILLRSVYGCYPSTAEIAIPLRPVTVAINCIAVVGTRTSRTREEPRRSMYAIPGIVLKNAWRLAGSQKQYTGMTA